nr:PREDICTED: uncharacterized protein LOC103562852 isoform X1 [Equus przewalskii]
MAEMKPTRWPLRPAVWCIPTLRRSTSRLTCAHRPGSFTPPSRWQTGVNITQMNCVGGCSLKEGYEVSMSFRPGLLLSPPGPDARDCAPCLFSQQWDRMRAARKGPDISSMDPFPSGCEAYYLEAKVC